MKPKLKPPTLDEIRQKIALATKESWIHTEPLFGWTDTATPPTIIPLQKSVEDKIRVDFLLDPLDYSTDAYLHLISRWLEDYHSLPWLPVIVLRYRYHFLKNEKFFDRYRNHPFFQNAVVFVDEMGDWFRHHQHEAPCVSLTEQELQNHFRRNDPGLPLIDLRENTIPPDQETRLTRADYQLQGIWSDLGDAIASDDNQASLTVDLKGTQLRIAAMSYPESRESAKVYIQWNGQPLPKTLYGTNVHLGDRGQGILEINRHTGIYEIMNSDDVLTGKVTFKFLNISENPVIVYGLRSQNSA